MVSGVSFNPKKNKFEVKDSGLSDDEKKKAEKEVQSRNEARRQESKDRASRYRTEKQAEKIDDQTVKNIVEISENTGVSPEAISSKIGYNPQAVRRKIERIKPKTTETMTSQESPAIMPSPFIRNNNEPIRATVEETITENGVTTIRRWTPKDVRTTLNLSDMREVSEQETYKNLFAKRPSVTYDNPVVETTRYGTFSPQKDKRIFGEKVKQFPQTIIRTLETELVKRDLESPQVISALEFGGGAVSGVSLGIFEFKGDEKIRRTLQGKTEIFEDPVVTSGKLVGMATELVYAPFRKATSKTLEFVGKRAEYSSVGEKILTSKPFLETQNKINAITGLTKSKIINPILTSKPVQNFGKSTLGKTLSASATGLGKLATGEDARSIRADLGIKKQPPKYVRMISPESSKPLGRGKTTDDAFKIVEKGKTELFEVTKQGLKETGIKGSISSTSKGNVVATGKDGSKLFKGITETKTFQEKIISPEVKVFGKTIFKPIKSSPQFAGASKEKFFAISKQLSGDRTGTIIKTQSDDLIAVYSGNQNIGTSAKGEELTKSVNLFKGKNSFGYSGSVSRNVQDKIDDVLTINIPKSNKPFVSGTQPTSSKNTFSVVQDKIDDVMQSSKGLLQKSSQVQTGKPKLVSLGFAGGGASRVAQVENAISKQISVGISLVSGASAINKNIQASQESSLKQQQVQIQKTTSKINTISGASNSINNVLKQDTTKRLYIGTETTQGLTVGTVTDQVQDQIISSIIDNPTIVIPAPKPPIQPRIIVPTFKPPKILRGGGGVPLSFGGIGGDKYGSIFSRSRVTKGLIKNPFLEAKEIQKKIKSGMIKREEEIKKRTDKITQIGKQKTFNKIKRRK